MERFYYRKKRKLKISNGKAKGMATTTQTKIIYYHKSGVEGGCPKCGNPDCPVSSKPSQRIRTHKCSKCNFTFKSVELAL